MLWKRCHTLLYSIWLNKFRYQTYEIRIYGRGVGSNIYPVQFLLPVPGPVFIAPAQFTCWRVKGGGVLLADKLTGKRHFQNRHFSLHLLEKLFGKRQKVSRYVLTTVTDLVFFTNFVTFHFRNVFIYLKKRFPLWPIGPLLFLIIVFYPYTVIIIFSNFFCCGKLCLPFNWVLPSLVTYGIFFFKSKWSWILSLRVNSAGCKNRFNVKRPLFYF